MNNQRSPEARAYRKLYGSRRWLVDRLRFLEQNPLCERCQAQGRVVAATVVHHRKPHRGDEALFFDWANFEALCAPHHDSDAQSEDRLGFSKTVDAFGWPSDERHPVNRGYRR